MSRNAIFWKKHCFRFLMFLLFVLLHLCLQIAVMVIRPIKEFGSNKMGYLRILVWKWGEFIDNIFKEKWIKRRVQFEWLVLLPDITPLDFFLWGHLKVKVYTNTTKQLGPSQGPHSKRNGSYHRRYYWTGNIKCLFTWWYVPNGCLTYCGRFVVVLLLK